MVSYVAYIGQMIWPAGLAVFYPYPEGGWTLLQSILAFLVLVIISVAFFMIANELFMNLKMPKQISGMPSVFRRNYIRRFQDLQRA